MRKERLPGFSWRMADRISLFLEISWLHSRTRRALCRWTGQTNGTEKSLPRPAQMRALRSLRLFSGLLFAFPFLQALPHPTVALAACILLLQMTLLSDLLAGRLHIRFGRLDACAGVFCLLSALGGIYGAGEVQDGLIAGFFASVWFSVRALWGRELIRRSSLAIRLSALITALAGVLQYALGNLTPMWLDADRFSDIGGRVTSFFGNPNILSVYLLLTLPFSAVEAIRPGRRGAGRLFDVGCTLSSLACLLLTFTRGAWLGALLELFLILLISSRTSRAMLWILPGPLGSLLPFLPHIVTSRFLSIASPGESSNRYRLYTWSGMSRMIAEHPGGIGVGEAAFAATYPQYAVSGTERVMHAHNLYLQIAAELGIAGLLLFLALLIGVLCRAMARRGISAAAIAVSGALVMGLFDHLWYERGLLAFFFGVLAAASGKETE